jgi:DNA-binding transcriptional LysR family regulator
MELRHLRYFAAVAEEPSFRKAAQSLGISHPSLCHQIMNLENEVGTRLFERNQRGVALTESGHIFLEGARKTLKCAVETIETTRKTARLKEGELCITNIGLMCPSLLDHLIRAFHERFPNVQVSIVQQNKFERTEAVLERAKFRIGYLRGGSKRQVRRARSWVIATAPFGVVVAGKKNEKVAKLRDFSGEPFLIPHSIWAPDYLEWVRPIFRQTGFKPERTVSVDSSEGFFSLLRAGAGVALLSQLHLPDQAGDLCFRKLSDTVEHFALSLMWDAKSVSPLLNEFLGVVRQVLPKPNGVSWDN